MILTKCMGFQVIFRNLKTFKWFQKISIVVKPYFFIYFNHFSGEFSPKAMVTQITLQFSNFPWKKFLNIFLRYFEEYFTKIQEIYPTILEIFPKEILWNTCWIIIIITLLWNIFPKYYCKNPHFCVVFVTTVWGE